MKKLMIFAVLLVALAVFPQASFAQIPTPDSYDSGFQVANLSDTNDANIVMNFYNQDGSTAASVSDTIGSGGSTTYFPLPAGVPAGFDGSLVLASDQPIASIANVLGVTGGSVGGGSSYSGFSGGADTVSIPLLHKNNFGINSWFNVQNAGSAPTTVTVNYVGTGGCTENATIQPGAAATFDQASNGCLVAGWFGAATVTAGSGDSVVATVMQIASSGIYAYNAFASGSTTAYAPLISANNFGYHTGMQVQNQGAGNTTVTVTYTPAGGSGTACTETATISGGSSDTFALYAFSLTPPGGVTPPTSTCVFGETFVGSAEISSTGGNSVVAIINQTNFSEEGSAYSAFGTSDATGTVVFPLMMDAFGFFTGMNVMNVGSSTTVTCSYSDAPGSDFSEVLGSGAVFNEVQDISNLVDNTGGNGYVGSAVCTATGGGAILGVANQVLIGADNVDNTFTHEAINN